MSKETTKVIIIKETIIKSIIKDIFTLGSLLVACMMNYMFCGGSYIISGLFVIIFFLYLITVGEKRKMTISEAKEYLKKLEVKEKKRKQIK